MLTLIDRFISEESGAVSLDWIVLTAVIAGTALSVVGTVSGGIDDVALETSDQLREQVVRQSFGSDLCAGGLDGVRMREAESAAARGDEPIDPDTWFATYSASLRDADLLRDYARMADGRPGGTWSRNDTIRGLMACDIVLRGLD